MGWYRPGVYVKRACPVIVAAATSVLAAPALLGIAAALNDRGTIQRLIATGADPNAQWRQRHREAERLVRQLPDEVVNMPVPQPYTTPRWTRPWVPVLRRTSV
jgi:hypothetical protein